MNRLPTPTLPSLKKKKKKKKKLPNGHLIKKPYIKHTLKTLLLFFFERNIVTFLIIKFSIFEFN